MKTLKKFFSWSIELKPGSTYDKKKEKEGRILVLIDINLTLRLLLLCPFSDNQETEQTNYCLRPRVESKVKHLTQPKTNKDSPDLLVPCKL